MLNEWREFLDYTRPVIYKADSKKDTVWLGRFTFEALREFGGLSRILTVLARGFLFHDPDGAVTDQSSFVDASSVWIPDMGEIADLKQPAEKRR